MKHKLRRWLSQNIAHLLEELVVIIKFGSFGGRVRLFSC